MSTEVLVTIILQLCDKSNLNPKEMEMQCMERLVNCAVLPDGNIMTVKQFTDICADVKQRTE
jgi:hypothetical protein